MPTKNRYAKQPKPEALKHIDINKLPTTKEKKYNICFGKANYAGVCSISLPDPTTEPDRFWFELRLVEVYGRGIQAQVYRDELVHLDKLIEGATVGRPEVNFSVLPMPEPKPLCYDLGELKAFMNVR